MTISMRVLAAGTVMSLATVASADNILFINGSEGSHPWSIQANNDLINLGHNVTTLTNPPGSYAGYDQVWDFRYNTNMTNQDATDMGAFLQSGGRMLVLAENSGFEGSRNQSLKNWVNQVGGGVIGNFVNGCFAGTENVTNAGQVVMQPNAFNQIAYNCSTTYNTSGTGFLVSSGPNGDGSIIGWNFGDIAGSPNARMLFVADIECWEAGNGNGINFTDDLATYLGRVPAPGTASLIGLAGLAAARRRRNG